ncbi:MAG: NAD-dependent epimerase/dehydratase family protein [Bernardetiaceae bacterium]|nr:NAD-dependent epimerase/dehydratase family protein [Bernardetiaceae bacterium]
MKCFITGANGLIGSYIARHLLAQGWTLYGLRRSNSDMRFIDDIASQIHWFEGDICEPFGWEMALEGIDYIVHAAAFVSLAKQDEKRMFEINIEGTANLVNMASQYPIKKFCHISSVAAIGEPLPNRNSIAENHLWDNDVNHGSYPRSKHFSEREVWRAAIEGLPVIILNPSFVLGFGDPNRSSSALFGRLKKGLPFYGTGSLNYVDAEDLAHITHQALISDITSERYIVNAGKITYRQLFAQITELLDTKAPKRPLPYWLGEVAWRLDAARSFFTGKSPQITKQALQASRRNFLYEPDKLKKDFKYEFKALEDSLQNICPKYKAFFQAQTASK